MLQPLLFQDAADRAKLAGVVEAALSSTGYSLKFPAALEARYHADNLTEDLRVLRIFGVSGGFFYAAFLLIDFEMVPDIWGLALAVRWLVLLATFVISLLITQPEINSWLRDIVLAGLHMAAMGGLVLLFMSTHSENKVAIINGMCLVMVFGTFGVPVRWRVTAVCMAVTVLLIICVVMMSNLPFPTRLSDSVVAVSMFGLTTVMNYRLKYQRRRTYLLALRESLRHADIVDTNVRLKILSEHDGLTNLLNRRAIDAQFQAAYAECAELLQPIGVLVLDIDNFKGFNDRYGHQAGDACLRHIADIMTRELRKANAHVGRFGGEEFLAVLPNQDFGACRAMAEQLLIAIRAAHVPHEGGVGFPKVVTASIGVAHAPPGTSLTTDSLLQKADERLYRAKHDGRNRVVWSDDEAPLVASAA